MTLYRTSNGIYYTATSRIAGGGEADVYHISKHPNHLLKIYKQHKRTLQLERKLRVMKQYLIYHNRIVWVNEIVYLNGQFHGYKMPYVDAKQLIVLMNPRSRKSYFKGTDWKFLHNTAKNLALITHHVHQQGYVIGDVNQQNFLFDQSGYIYLIDTDSMQVQKGGQTFLCEVGKPEFTPAEVKNYQIVRHTYHDNFGIAVLIFQLLMEGAHPFLGNNPRNSKPVSTADHIKAGQFLHSPNRNYADKPPHNVPKFAILHPKVRSLFIQAFEDGHSRPSQRPSALHWSQALEKASSDLRQCTRDSTHWYFPVNGNCPWCRTTSSNISSTNSHAGTSLNQQQKTVQPPVYNPPVQPAKPKRNFIWVWGLIVGVVFFVVLLNSGEDNSNSVGFQQSSERTVSRPTSRPTTRPTSRPQTAQLLSGGRGLTDGSYVTNGNFQVESFCSRRGQSIDNDNRNWYCLRGNTRVYTLTQSDFNQICRDTYNRSDAFAQRISSGNIPAYNWRCYGYTTSNSNSNNNSSSSNNSSHNTTRTCGGMNTLFREGDTAIVDFNGNGALRILRNYNSSTIQTIAQLYDNNSIQLLDGPICYGSVWYWQIYYRPMNAYGWIAEGRNGDRFLCPTSNRECS
ncbi:MAG: hypothetical protein AAF846_25405 [Chloroflexota bacterium]